MPPPSQRDTRESGRGADAAVHIEDYDPAWPSRFERERALLAVALRQWISGPIEHVGSTAVPGLAAKPVIDIMGAVESLDASREALPALQPLGYLYLLRFYRYLLSTLAVWFIAARAALHYLSS